ncbi:MAG TPA: TetR/AcrR family transcriptional regulator [Spirochaetota bacterium]|nr:TetR/AcrR family transcriptional regulator [Spirochaetota bacterium]HPQ52884.1 TetR/AcrR family transcriptional regulator [Spirochaetota bacterium]
MDRKRKMILTNATNLIKRYGIKKTTIEDIAKECKLTTSALYYYFKNKDEIISEVFLLIQEEKMITMKKNLEQQKGDAISKLKNYITSNLNFLLSFRRDYSINIYDIADQFDTLQKAKSKGIKDEKELVKSILEEGSVSGLLSIENIDLTAELINHLIGGIAGFIFHSEDDNHLNKYIEEMPDMIIHILMKGLEARNA